MRPRFVMLLALVAAALALPAPASAGPVTAQVVVQPQGAGHGSVGGTSSLSGNVISCVWNGSTAIGPCSDVAFGPAFYTVTASPIEGAVFAGWSGTCPAPASGNVCAFFVNGTSVTLKPTFANPTMTVTKEGTGSGTVTSSPAGINCGSTCTSTFVAGASVTLTATPAPGSTFTGWGGLCGLAPPSGTCTLTANVAELAVVATFTGSTPTPPPASTSTLNVRTTGTGGGTVVSSPTGISCLPTCAASFPTGTKVTLTATPDKSSSLGAWGGACARTTGNVCIVTLAGPAATASVSFVRRSTAVEADVIAVRVVRSALGQRVVQVELAADEQVAVKLRLARGKSVLAARTFAVFPPGQRVLRLVVPTSVAAGTAKLTVTLTNEADTTKRVKRSVAVPGAR